MINGVIHAQAKTSNPVEAAALLRVIVQINRVFMGPSLVLIPLSGLWLMYVVGYNFRMGWLVVSFGLSLALILAFIIGGRIERRLYDIATTSADQGGAFLPPAYDRGFRQAAPIGGGALVAGLAALILMIFKPF